MLRNPESFVGRGFSRDMSAARLTGLQPLKFPEAYFAASCSYSRDGSGEIRISCFEMVEPMGLVLAFEENLGKTAKVQHLLPVTELCILP